MLHLGNKSSFAVFMMQQEILPTMCCAISDVAFRWKPVRSCTSEILLLLLDWKEIVPA